MSDLWPALGGPIVNYISFPPPLAWQTRFPRSLVILGSTGSIGRSALDVVSANRDLFTLQGLACFSNVQLLARQADIFRPPYLAVGTDEAASILQDILPPNYRPDIFVGEEGYAKLVRVPEAETVLSAQSGGAGLAGTIAAALAGRVILLANKESLVLAGSLVRDICSLTGAAILPVDSEHNALFQCLAGRGQDVDRLVLTASGGPFRGRNKESLASVTLEDALHHPNWQMGRKITIDSATLMNKGLEVIEAYHLYGIRRERIEVVLHPESIVHSLVRFTDASLLAQLATADMKLPLAHCMLWPKKAHQPVAPLDLCACTLSFEPPDMETFPCLGFALRALSERGGHCVVLNAANEAAVELFLQGSCRFTDIPILIAEALDAHTATRPGHEPFCPPLGRASDMVSLESRVRDIQKNIQVLDARTRDFVRNLARTGDSSC
ncbi:MAG: 1-deoxy-D-xylulose-5-phosphate reductoisomerase [Desulfovibrio sp.]|nr:1-deoxy-D-xylulose-5-phosphate reductoisomerase [Desulfovibrio sp.]